MKIAAGEWQNTRFEFLDLLDEGKIDVAQPDIGRVGGFTEAMRVCSSFNSVWPSGAPSASSTPYTPSRTLSSSACVSSSPHEPYRSPIRPVV